MKSERSLVVSSLLGVVLLSLHLADDIVRGFDRVGPQNIAVVAILVTWLLGVQLVGRRSGYALLMLGGLFALGMPILHLQGRGIATVIASPGGFFFLWTLFAVGTAGTFSFLLAAHGLLRSRRPRSTS
jgi:hypothetical protein